MQQPLFPKKELTSKEFMTLNKGLKKKKAKKEEKIQLSLSRYVRAKYPSVIFSSDVASGMKMTIGQAVKAKMMRSERGWSDMVFLEPKGDYKALCLELKNEVSDVYLSDGVTISDCKSKQHVREQAALLKRLREKGYWADFGFSLDGCIKIVDTYMSL